MPLATTYPGVYIEEMSSGVRTISGVSTSVAAFVGYASRGPENIPVRLFSYADYERNFGGLVFDSELSYAVKHFFDNGGSQAIVVHIPKTDRTASSITLKNRSEDEFLTITAVNQGASGNNITIDIDYDFASYDPITDGYGGVFNIRVSDVVTGSYEEFEVSMVDNVFNSVVSLINNRSTGSKLIAVSKSPTTDHKKNSRPVATGLIGKAIDFKAFKDIDLRKKYGLNIIIKWSKGEFKYNVKTNAQEIKILESIQSTAEFITETVNNAILIQRLMKDGVRIKCVAVPGENRLRVLADLDQTMYPDSMDAVVTFSDPEQSTKLTDSSSIFGLRDPIIKNVSKYVLGTVSKYDFTSTPGSPESWVRSSQSGSDGTMLPSTFELIGSPKDYTGLYSLEKVDSFNILCIPDATRSVADEQNPPNANAIFFQASSICETKRAFLIIDPPPDVVDLEAAIEWKSTSLRSKNAAAYFPQVRVPDPLNDYQLRSHPPCGIIAGLYARTDSERGIWKAPAGTEAFLRGVQGMSYKLTDPENGLLNPLGLNCLRRFPSYGSVSWGARTLVGSDAEASEWKYIPVRRLALYIEESLYQGTQWVVFEPNDEPLWSQIRLNINAFMQSLFQQGAFAGKSPRDAYEVKCDSSTTTPDDINRGRVNIVVKFAPVKPAEFVVVSIQQMAGQGLV